MESLQMLQIYVLPWQRLFQIVTKNFEKKNAVLTKTDITEQLLAPMEINTLFTTLKKN